MISACYQSSVLDWKPYIRCSESSRMCIDFSTIMFFFLKNLSNCLENLSNLYSFSSNGNFSIIMGTSLFHFRTTEKKIMHGLFKMYELIGTNAYIFSDNGVLWALISINR